MNQEEYEGLIPEAAAREPSMTQSVYRSLVELILSGQLRPGLMVAPERGRRRDEMKAAVKV